MEEEVRDVTPAQLRWIHTAMRRTFVEPSQAAGAMIRWMKNVNEDLLILSSRIAELEQAAPAPAKTSKKRSPALPPEEELAPPAADTTEKTEPVSEV
jgi:hypothetical protein